MTSSQHVNLPGDAVQLGGGRWYLFPLLCQTSGVKENEEEIKLKR
jgi:hypothetical protein